MEGVPAGPMYIGLSTLRNGEVVLRWTRAQLFILMHSVALSGVIPLVVKGPNVSDFPLVVTISVVGFLVGCIWVGATYKADNWVSFWNARLKELEQLEEKAPIKIFGSDEFKTVNAVSRKLQPTYHGVLLLLAWLSVLT